VHQRNRQREQEEEEEDEEEEEVENYSFLKKQGKNETELSSDEKIAKFLQLRNSLKPKNYKQQEVDVNENNVEEDNNGNWVQYVRNNYHKKKKET